MLPELMIHICGGAGALVTGLIFGHGRNTPTAAALPLEIAGKEGTWSHGICPSSKPPLLESWPT